MALDDPITEYLGAIVRPHVGSPSEVTLRRTLQNAAGFPVHAQLFQGSRLKYSCVVRTGEFSTLAFA